MTSSQIVHSARARLGPVGVWLGVLGRAPIDEERRAARRIEELGYGSIWTPEGIGGKEAFAHQSVLLAVTRRIVTGTGIANVWPATLPQCRAARRHSAPPTLADLFWASASATRRRSNAADRRT
ncbi:MAG: LLM class flavin-dependent oxidoreductase [Chloroflexota bacterium]